MLRSWTDRADAALFLKQSHIMVCLSCHVLAGGYSPKRLKRILFIQDFSFLEIVSIVSFIISISGV